MKQLISFLLAGFIGGITTYGLILYKNPIKSDTSVSEKTSYFAGYNAPLDFTKAADKALDAVVHIKATESPEAAENRFRQSYQQRSPFSFFLGEDDLEGFTFIPTDVFYNNQKRFYTEILTTTEVKELIKKLPTINIFEFVSLLDFVNIYSEFKELVDYNWENLNMDSLIEI